MTQHTNHQTNQTNLIENFDRVDLTPLTPLLFMERTAQIFPDKIGGIYGEQRYTYRQLASETTRLANALVAMGIGKGDRVAYMLANLPQMLIAHFGVPLAGAVLVPINIRLSPAEIQYILKHSGSKILVVDSVYYEQLAPLLAELSDLGDTIVLFDQEGEATSISGVTSYTDLLERGSEQSRPWRVEDELSPITLNYTSGTTGQPKGVIYTHRGAYLNAMAEMIHSQQTPESVYLWTLPMFHCNGWCTTWGLTGWGGTHVFLRNVEPGVVWDQIHTHRVTHLNAAPTVLIGLANHPRASGLEHPLTVTTAGAAPSPTLIESMSKLGAKMVHVYGLTETYGPITVCQPQVEWQTEDPATQSQLLARQGMAFMGVDPIRVVDEDMKDVAQDGQTIGEVVMRGNNVMLEYFDDPAATTEAFRGGWFHSGDLAVWHPDGYIELRDRAKDIIISGGENISTIEVEQALMSHPEVLEAAVVAIPDDYWGERPLAYVVRQQAATITAETLIDYVKTNLAKYKAPDRVEFVTELPKTSTGKIQKYVLRQSATT